MQFRLAIASAALLCSCAPNPQNPGGTAAEPQFPVKITQFYATPNQVTPGGRALLCYGVEFASTVKIEPYPEKLPVAVSKCVEVFPKQTQSYKLTATGRDGKTVEQTVPLTVDSSIVARPESPGGAPRLRDLAISSQKVKKGDLVSFCFKSDNATAVVGGPGRFQKGGIAASDCLLDQPQKTTTYRVTVRNAAGQSDSDAITVKVE